MHLWRTAVYGIAPALAVGCATPHGTHADDAVIPSDVLALEVENHNWSDILIYMLHDGVRTRFVHVTASRSLTRAIPARLVGSDGTVRFVVHRIGGHDDSLAPAGGPDFATPLDDYVSPAVSVRTGYTVSLTVEDNLHRSTLAVW